MNWFVTGASRGIGASIVLRAVRDGHDVAFTYNSNPGAAARVVEEARALRPDARCLAYALDVGDPAQVERVGDLVLDALDDIHVVVNNAGISRDNLVATMSDEEWHQVLATNLSGPFYVCRHFLSGMLANRFGRIVNLSSISAYGATGQANYAASKAGLLGLTRSLAKEYGPKGITANVVVLGFFDTEMTRQYASDANKAYWNTYCPTRRIGEVSEIDGVVAFLASEASSFVNGVEIPIHGGLDYVS